MIKKALLNSGFLIPRSICQSDQYNFVSQHSYQICIVKMFNGKIHMIIAIKNQLILNDTYRPWYQLINEGKSRITL